MARTKKENTVNADHVSHRVILEWAYLYRRNITLAERVKQYERAVTVQASSEIIEELNRSVEECMAELVKIEKLYKMETGNELFCR